MWLLPSHRGHVAPDLPDKLRHMAINIQPIVPRVSLAGVGKASGEGGVRCRSVGHLVSQAAIPGVINTLAVFLPSHLDKLFTTARVLLLAVNCVQGQSPQIIGSGEFIS
jgi:hypothetical protein